MFSFTSDLSSGVLVDGQSCYLAWWIICESSSILPKVCYHDPFSWFSDQFPVLRLTSVLRAWLMYRHVTWQNVHVCESLLVTYQKLVTWFNMSMVLQLS